VPVERKSARLMLRQQQGVHSLTVNCVNKFELHLPGDRVLARAEQINAELEENVQAVDAQGASLVLAYTNFKTTGDDGRQVRPGRRPRVGGAALATEMTKLRLLLRQDPNGNLLENKVDSSRVPSPTTRSALEEMSRQIQHSLEVLSVPLPNKEVRPLQQWKAWRNVPIGTPGNFEAGAVDMTYTYLGRRRNQANREEAVLSLEGAVQGRQGAELSIGGQATGTAQIDLETGLVRSAKITVKVDLDTKFRIEDDDKVVELGVKAVGTLEVSLERSVP
jgi:hypothetical protein